MPRPLLTPAYSGGLFGCVGVGPDLIRPEPARGRSGRSERELRGVAPTKRPGRARSKASARSEGSRKREHQHPELIGLGLTALGLFLAIVLWLGWDGGVVGEKVGDALRFLVGRAVVLVPAGLLAIGGLLVARSRLIDLRPFQTGLGVLGLAVLLAFGGDRFGLGPGGGAPKALDADMVDGHGGVLGAMLYIVFEKLLGEAGFTILTVLALVMESCS